MLTRLTTGGVTVSVAVTDPFSVAVVVTIVCDETLLVVTVNAPVVLPEGMGTLEDTNVATVGSLLESSTTVGFIGICVRVTVPFRDAPP
jgi:hypothetical protein